MALRGVLILALAAAVGLAAYLLLGDGAGRACAPLPNVSVDAPGDPTAVSVGTSAEVWPCAATVVVADATDAASLAFGARLAAQEQGPLIAVGPGERPEVESELERLDPDAVLVVGGPTIVAAVRGVTESWDLADPIAAEQLELRIRSAIPDPNRPAVGIPDDPAGAFAAARTAIAENRPIVYGPGTAGAQKPPLSPGGALWIAADPFAAIASLAAADATGALVVLVDSEDPRRSVDVRATAPDAGSRAIVGDLTDQQRWQLGTLLEADELPGGGVLVFDPNTRYVAAYGNPNTSALGVLGEAGPSGWEETAARLESMVVGYDADGFTVVPTFEIIITVAAGDPGPDGDYSAEMRIDTITGWVDYAAANGLYVVLDLQPGRSDFLSQARRYEELLKRPHVGLALDPEWRLAPDQVHLAQVGSVDVSEVNATAEWLASVVRQNGLPQKMFVVHQFQTAMIRGRDAMVIPPELAGLVQMDGQGPLGGKYVTWEALTEGTESAPFRWGWKNFYDEDSPTARPDEILALEPTVWFVSYQ